jgi:TatD DNase family protein
MSGKTGWPEAPEPLPYPVIDNHCHLDISRTDEEPLAVEEALARATASGIPRIVQVGCDLAGSRWAARAASSYDEIVAAIALHPNEVPELAERGELDAAIAELDLIATQTPRVRAIGETGLDYFRTDESGRDAQHDSFRRHIELAKKHDLALMIHDRDAHDDVLAILGEVGAPERWVMHCFSGDADFARRCLDRGAYLSFAGTVTFKNAEPLREALAVAPRDRILVETDAPFLTPVPHRGRNNASYLIPLTVRSMAQTRGDDLGELCEAIETNTFAAYGGAWGLSKA